MAQKATDWKKAAKDFASDYLLPLFGFVVLVFIGIGVVALAGLGLTIAIPVALVMVLVLIAALLTSEMTWRIAVLNAVLGVGATFYAVNVLLREPIATLVGITLGILLVWALYLSGDPTKISEKASQEGKTLTDAVGQTHKVLFLSGDRLDLQMGIGSAVGLLLLLVCLVWQEHGAWSFFLGLYTALALGRAIAWFGIEADTGVKVLWRPFALLRQYPPFQQVFRWWHQTRQLLGIGLAHWTRE